MVLRARRKACVLLVALVGLLSPNVQAEQEEVSAMVYPREDEPVLVEDVQFMPLGGLNYSPFLKGTWRGSSAYLPFEEIRRITYLKPGQEDEGDEAEVIFNDGRKRTFVLETGTFQGKSEFGGTWSIGSRQVAKMDFNPSIKGQIETSGRLCDFDQIFFKNGDTICGKVKTGAFILRTAYAKLDFQGPQIAHIDFGGGGKNLDVVVLKNGDKLSGDLDVKIITLLMQSGAEVNLDKEKLKRINFKE